MAEPCARQLLRRGDAGPVGDGTPERIRTSDLYLRRVALSPLSYWRTSLVPKVRFELTRPQGALRPERSASACSATSAPPSSIGPRALAFKPARWRNARPRPRLNGRGRLAQMVRARRSHRRGHWFESSIAHHAPPADPPQPQFVPDAPAFSLAGAGMRGESVHGPAPAEFTACTATWQPVSACAPVSAIAALVPLTFV